MSECTYLQLRKKRDLEIQNVSSNHILLNQFHDKLIQQVVNEAIRRIHQEWGPPPSPFCFFMMGSGGRFEQAIWSDQDNGLLFLEKSEEAMSYFLKLGKEISEGLFIVGYPRCDGEVMASNSLWCQSFLDWKKQLTKWVTDESWDSIRYLLIFMDARPLYGDGAHLDDLKIMVHKLIHEHHLLKRILENTMHVKKGINVLGKLLVETHGSHAGSLNLKETAFLPYVNSIRLLALKEKILSYSTLSRIQNLSPSTMSEADKKWYEEQFLKLLDVRLKYGSHENYESEHYLPIEKLNKEQIKEVKEILKAGLQLHLHTRKVIEKGV